jgi:hypothetical protein
MAGKGSGASTATAETTPSTIPPVETADTPEAVAARLAEMGIDVTDIEEAPEPVVVGAGVPVDVAREAVPTADPTVVEIPPFEGAPPVIGDEPTGTDLAVVERAEILPARERWAQMEAMSDRLARSNLVPKAFRGRPDDVLVTLLTAHDLGITATLALQKINVIEGKPAQSAELMRLLIRRDGHTLTVRVDRDSAGRPDRAFAVGRRRDDPADFSLREATFSVEDAVAAGLCTVDGEGNVRQRGKEGKKGAWEKFTVDMLVARATSRWARWNAEDSLGGVSYTPDELYVENEPSVAAGPVRPVVADGPRATEEQRAEMNERLAALTAELRESVARGLASLEEMGKIAPRDRLRVDDVVLVLEVIGSHEPTDAEIVQPDTTMEPCPTCGSTSPCEHPF